MTTGTTLRTVMVRYYLDNIEDRYDPERDTVEGALTVTWADNELASTIRQLLYAVEDLQRRVKELEPKE